MKRPAGWPDRCPRCYRHLAPGTTLSPCCGVWLFTNGPALGAVGRDFLGVLKPRLGDVDRRLAQLDGVFDSLRERLQQVHDTQDPLVQDLAALTAATRRSLGLLRRSLVRLTCALVGLAVVMGVGMVVVCCVR